MPGEGVRLHVRRTVPGAGGGGAMGRMRPSLVRWSLFAATWQLSVWVGWALVLASVVVLRRDAGEHVGPEMLVIAALVILGELRPVVASTAYADQGAPIS